MNKIPKDIQYEEKSLAFQKETADSMKKLVSWVRDMTERLEKLEDKEIHMPEYPKIPPFPKIPAIPPFPELKIPDKQYVYGDVQVKDLESLVMRLIQEIKDKDIDFPEVQKVISVDPFVIETQIIRDFSGRSVGYIDIMSNGKKIEYTIERGSDGKIKDIKERGR